MAADMHVERRGARAQQVIVHGRDLKAAFNAVKPGDKVVVIVSEIGGVKTVTKLEKQ
jgi:hypothetical protein